MRSIRLKIPHLAYYILKDVIYIPQFQRNLIPLIRMRYQGHSIHLFDDIIEIRRACDNSVIMIGVEEGALLK